MATDYQRQAWKLLRQAGATVLEAKQELKLTIEEVQDCEHMMTQHERLVW